MCSVWQTRTHRLCTASIGRQRTRRASCMRYSSSSTRVKHTFEHGFRQPISADRLLYLFPINDQYTLPYWRYAGRKFRLATYPGSIGSYEHDFAREQMRKGTMQFRHPFYCTREGVCVGPFPDSFIDKPPVRYEHRARKGVCDLFWCNFGFIRYNFVLVPYWRFAMCQKT